MRALLALYKKEMKTIRDISIAISIVIFLAILVAEIGQIFYVFHHQNLQYYSFRGLLTSKGILLFVGGPYIFAVILAYTFFIERKTRTDYQIFSFPVDRGLVILGKLSAVISYALLLSLGIALFVTLTEPLDLIIRYHYSHYNVDMLWNRFKEVLWVSSMEYFVILSMTAASFSAMYRVKHQRILTAVGAFILLHGVYDLTSHFIWVYIGWTSIPSIKLAQYWCVEGIIFSLIAFYLYQRYADI